MFHITFKSVYLIGCRGGKRVNFRIFFFLFFSEIKWRMKPKLGILA